VVSWASLGSEFSAPAFWLSVLQIGWINILLSGDNAAVIALACRDLPYRRRIWGMAIGAGVAVVLRILFTAIVAPLLLLPYLKIVGGLALLYIAAKLVVPDEPDASETAAAEHLWRAVGIIAVADVVMSFDNVVAIAAAAGDNLLLIVIGLALSVPLIVAGAALIVGLLDRFPILIWGGAALLGWIAGEVIATDPVVWDRLVHTYGGRAAHLAEYVTAVAGVSIALIAGWLWRRAKQESEV
jgi:YjbE family integral membrane protein